MTVRTTDPAPGTRRCPPTSLDKDARVAWPACSLQTAAVISCARRAVLPTKPPVARRQRAQPLAEDGSAHTKERNGRPLCRRNGAAPPTTQMGNGGRGEMAGGPVVLQCRACRFGAGVGSAGAREGANTGFL